MIAGMVVASDVSGRPYEPRQKRYFKNPKLNRSSKWEPADTYAEARAISPYPNRPVR